MTDGTQSLFQDTEYVYSGSQNNGRILQTVNHTSGETVGYSYDTLNRLLTAGSTSGSWGESFTYDGFGNLTDKTVTAGSAPPLHITVNPANNQVESLYNYDANGNVTAGVGSFTAGYDALNRVIAASLGNGTDYYGYTPDNNRVWKQEPTTLNYGEIHFFGAYGEELGTYPIQGYQSQPGAKVQYYLAQTATNLYFAGRLVYRNSSLAVQDRLGSMGSYYPYGEEYTTTQQDQQKFATYYRDTTTVLDYARNRYYSSTLGRFMTADPYRNSAGPADPGSWNRYVYSLNDPVNLHDPLGMEGEPPDLVCNDYTGAICDLLYDAYGNSERKRAGSGGNPQVLNSLFAIDANLLKKLARQFAANLLSETFSTDCAADMAKLGITPEQWASALNKVSVLEGIGSTVPLASTLTTGSDEWNTARQRNLTVGGEFTPGSGTVAWSSVNGPQVWINPFYINPGDTLGNQALIAHETLHNLGLIDSTIQTDLGIPVTPITKNISDKLQSDCFPGNSGPSTLP